MSESPRLDFREDATAGYTVNISPNDTSCCAFATHRHLPDPHSHRHANLLGDFPSDTDYQPHELEYVREFGSYAALISSISLNAHFEHLDRDFWHIMNGFNFSEPGSFE